MEGYLQFLEVHFGSKTPLPYKNQNNNNIDVRMAITDKTSVFTIQTT